MDKNFHIAFSGYNLAGDPLITTLCSANSGGPLLLPGKGLTAIHDNAYAVYYKNMARREDHRKLEKVQIQNNQNMKRHISIPLFLLLILAGPVSAQDNYTISGHIKCGKTGEELIGSTIFVEALNTGTITNTYGFYSLTLPEGTYSLLMISNFFPDPADYYL